MSTRKVTSQDVARRARREPGPRVSRVFTPGASFSEKTAAKVRKAAGELGYRPNVLARSLITGRSRIIGLVGRLSGKLLLSRGPGEALERPPGKGLSPARVSRPTDRRRRRGTFCRRSSTTRWMGSSSPRWPCHPSWPRGAGRRGSPWSCSNRSQDGPRLPTVTPPTISPAAGRSQGSSPRADTADSATSRAGKAPPRNATGRRDSEPDCARRGTGLCAREARRLSVRPGTGGRPPHVPGRGTARRGVRGQRPHGLRDHGRAALRTRVAGSRATSRSSDSTDVPPAAWPAYDLTTVRQEASAMVAETVSMLLANIENPDIAPRHVCLPPGLIPRASARIPRGWLT